MIEKLKAALADFHLPGSVLTQFGDNKYLIQNYNWDYLAAENFQKVCVELVKADPAKQIFIACNHPSCFTMGRGLQKGKSDSLKELIPFNDVKLNLPVHKINRGGGLTFHHPGQFIFYPIVKLNTSDYSIHKIISTLLVTTKTAMVEEFGIDSLECNRELLGLWRGQNKLASIGIGIERYVTFHGMAVNILEDKAVLEDMKKVFPCGLTPETYTSLQKLSPTEENLLERFTKKFLGIFFSNDIWT